MNLFFPSCPQREREVHLVLSYFYSPRKKKRQRTAVLPAGGKFEHHFDVVSAQIGPARGLIFAIMWRTIACGARGR